VYNCSAITKYIIVFCSNGWLDTILYIIYCTRWHSPPPPPPGQGARKTTGQWPANPHNQPAMFHVIAFRYTDITAVQSLTHTPTQGDPRTSAFKLGIETNETALQRHRHFSGRLLNPSAHHDAPNRKPNCTLFKVEGH
jgi:hypothetical protein